MKLNTQFIAQGFCALRMRVAPQNSDVVESSLLHDPEKWVPVFGIMQRQIDERQV
jgi:hypothetical protein